MSISYSKVVLYILLVIFSFFTFAIFTEAHGTGESFEKEVSIYKIYIGYDPATFVVGESQRFDFDIYNSKNDTDVDFDNVWVNISQGNKTVFAGGVYNSDLGGAGMTFIFPEEGSYILNVRFQKAGNAIAEANFPITVSVDNSKKSQSSGETMKIIFSGFFGIIIGFSATKLFKRGSY